MNRTRDERTEEMANSNFIVAKEMPADDWNDIKGYMRIKEQKLLSQFHTTGNKVSNLFKGVSIYVNGFTEPSADELKTLIHDHGGMYCYHYSPSKVTHIITCNLPDTKVKNLNPSVVVCTPSWIVDSIAAEKILPVTRYRLYAKTNEQSSLNFDVLNKGKGPASGSAFKKTKLTENVVLDTTPERTDMYMPTTKKAKLTGGTISDNTSSERTTTNAATLISEFYTHSRLHHLSQWSSELKEFTTRMRNQITPKLVKLSIQQRLKKETSNVFVHIDLDCFFVSVGLRDRPQLFGKPIAVSHFKGTTSAIANTKETDKRLPTESMSDIASCNYEAREKGVHNGMSVGKGLQRCPGLEIIPYEFEKYQSVSHAFYETLLSFLPEIEAVSCDEAYLELTDYVTCASEACEIVEKMREEIFDKTNCHASAGIAHNMLLARLCTRVAKPCGQFCLLGIDAAQFLDSQSVSTLPGVGHSTASKLNDLGVTSCQQLRELPISQLHSEFGNKLGTTLYNFARGIDNRSLTLEVERKSLSADVNFGIRFQSFTDADEFIINLAKEVEKRATDSGVVGKQVTLKLKVRKADAPTETKKYLGHGICYNLSKSMHLPTATCKASALQTTCIQILHQMSVPVTDIRGIGIQLNKLRTTEEKVEYGDLRKAFARSQASPIRQTITSATVKPNAISNSQPSSSSALMDESFYIPPASQLDPSVFEALPEHYKVKISESHAKEKSKKACEQDIKHKKTLIVVPSTAQDTKTSLPSILDGNVVDVMIVFAYLRKWLHDSGEDGPTDNDVQLFREYMLGLLDDHMDVVYCILKHLWRKISSLQLIQWKKMFHQLLSSIQKAMQEKYHAPLNVEFMNC